MLKKRMQAQQADCDKRKRDGPGQMLDPAIVDGPAQYPEKNNGKTQADPIVAEPVERQFGEIYCQAVIGKLLVGDKSIGKSLVGEIEPVAGFIDMNGDQPCVVE